MTDVEFVGQHVEIKQRAGKKYKIIDDVLFIFIHRMSNCTLGLTVAGVR